MSRRCKVKRDGILGGIQQLVSILKMPSPGQISIFGVVGGWWYSWVVKTQVLSSAQIQRGGGILGWSKLKVPSPGQTSIFGMGVGGGILG